MEPNVVASIVKILLLLDSLMRIQQAMLIRSVRRLETQQAQVLMRVQSKVEGWRSQVE